MKRGETINEVTEITKYVKRLSVSERKALLDGLRKKTLLEEARELSKSVNKSIQVSMDDILKEISHVRKKNAA